MRTLEFVLAVLSIAFVTNSSDAITFEAKGFDELAAEAEQIFIGTATQARSRRADPGAIVTDYTFADLELVKGSADTASIRITMLGGTLGFDSLTISGAPTFSLGTRYLVFVAGNGAFMFPIVGGQQGIFQIRVDAKSGASHVYDYGGRPITELPSHSATATNRARASAVSNSDGSRTPAPLTKEIFVDAIRSKIH